MHPLIEKIFLVNEPFVRKYGPGMALISIVFSIVPIIVGVVGIFWVNWIRDPLDGGKNGEMNAAARIAPKDVPPEDLVEYLERTDDLHKEEISILELEVSYYEEQIPFLERFVIFLLIGFGCLGLSAGVVLLKLAEALKKLDPTNQSDLPTSNSAAS